MNSIINLLRLVFLIFFFLSSNAISNTLNKIEIIGNDRISDETIKLFSKVEIGNVIKEEDVNLILKELYETDYFENINISFINNTLTITLKEYPIIQSIKYKGVKSNSFLENITKEKLIKEKSPYNETSLNYERDRLKKIIRQFGYYNASLETSVINLDNNLVTVNFEIILGNKSKIKKITFIGNKIFKENKLKRLIASSEYKFWKFISGRKYLNENTVLLDKRLLKNFYLNNGYYNVEINSSFAKLIGDNEFELIFNIDANNKIYFGDLNLNIPDDFNKENFKKINKLFDKIKNEPYSINLINRILNEIDEITAIEQYKFIKATVDQVLTSDKINLSFNISETEKFYVERINILGNFVTEETVIRNQLKLDEGDPFNEILFNKSINQMKSLNFFKSVRKEIIDGEDINTKILNIYVEEKPTGEIFANAGAGTSGGSIGFGVKENNFLGKGISLNSNFDLSANSFKGEFGIFNPNFNNTDKSIYTNFKAIENDNYETFGYKSNKTGFDIGTNFEYYNNFRFGIGTSNYYEVIKTNSTASEAQQNQEGNYWDSFLKLDFNYDKRDQKFQTKSGFRSYYSLDLPVVSENNTLKNTYNYSYYFDIFDENISSLSLFLKSANSINNKDVKLSERIKIPSSKLRGFEAGRFGPKDGDDFIGGNFGYALNFTSTIPKILENSQNVDFLFFIDAANLWGVDYDSSISSGGSIRSSTGVALDWFSPVGPLNFSLAYPISKENGDKEEAFRFNLGTTF
jgi:outer membrane protein insertion porin family